MFRELLLLNAALGRPARLAWDAPDVRLRQPGNRAWAAALARGMRTGCVPPRLRVPAVLRMAAGSDVNPRIASAPVEATGLEPVTYDLQSRCSTN